MNKKFFIFIFYIYFIVIILLNTIPTPQAGVISANSLLLHFLEFFILGVIILLAGVMWQAGLIISVLAEIVQGFLPYRVFSLVDISLNLFGFFIGFSIFYSTKLIKLNNKNLKKR